MKLSPPSSPGPFAPTALASSALSAVLPDSATVRPESPVTAAVLSDARAQLKSTGQEAENRRARVKQDSAQRLRLEALHDERVRNQSSSDSDSPDSPHMPAFSLDLLLSNRQVPLSGMAETLKAGMQRFLETMDGSQHGQDLLLDATLKTPRDWREMLVNLVQDPGTSSLDVLSPPVLSIIDELALDLPRIIASHGPHRFTEDPGTLLVDGKQYVYDKELGSGYEGVAVRYRNAIDASDTLVLKSPASFMGVRPEDVEQLRDEIRIHRLTMGPTDKLSHNVVALKGAILDHAGTVHSLMEESKGGTLENFEKVLHVLTETGIVSFAAKQVIKQYTAVEVSGLLQELHQKKLVHRDIRKANILLEEDGSTKLADFDKTRESTPKMEAKSAEVRESFSALPAAAMWRTADSSATVSKKEDVAALKSILEDAPSARGTAPDMTTAITAHGRFSAALGNAGTQDRVASAHRLLRTTYGRAEDVNAEVARETIRAVVDFGKALSPKQQMFVQHFYQHGRPQEYTPVFKLPQAQHDELAASRNKQIQQCRDNLNELRRLAVEQNVASRLASLSDRLVA